MEKKKVVTLEDSVGIVVYLTLIKMLKVMVPRRKPHRLAVVIASMLQYTPERSHMRSGSGKRNSIAEASIREFLSLNHLSRKGTT